MSILLQKLTRLGRGILAGTLNGILPGDCHLCGARCGADFVCADCRHELPSLPSALCPTCGQPCHGSLPCGRCQRHRPAFDALVAAFPYRFPIDALILEYKYRHRLQLASWFARQLAPKCRTLKADLLLPVPLHPNRLRERGFNQAVEIGRPLSRLLDLQLPTDTLERERETCAQESLSPLERRRNVRRAFACRADLSGKRILLLDDVVTTGATVEACSRVLRQHGAAHITVLAAARTLLDG